MEGNLCKEEHPRFQRAKDARETQQHEDMKDVTNMTDEEMLKETEEILRGLPPNGDQREQGTASSKRKSEDEGRKHVQEQRTSQVLEGEEEGKENGEKRGLQVDVDTAMKDKRIRLETQSTTTEQQVTLDTIARDYNISLLEKMSRKKARNTRYDVKAVVQGQIKKLLSLTSTLPDVNKFHDADKSSTEISSKIAWDDLTGMKLDAGKVKEARGKELEYIKQKGVWTKIPRSVAHARGWKIIKTRWIDVNKGDDDNPK